MFDYKIWKKEYNIKNRAKISEYYREWYQKNGRNRAIDYAEAIAEWRKNNPEKVKAHNLLNWAVVSGKVIKPKKCDKCKEERRLSGHHLDYRKPLEVLWLCSSCHKEVHKVDNLI